MLCYYLNDTLSVSNKLMSQNALLNITFMYPIFLILENALIIFIKAYKQDLTIVFGFFFAIFAIYIYRHNIILIRLIHQSIMMSSYKHHPSSGFFSAFLFAIIYCEIISIEDFQIPFKIYRHKYLGSKYSILSIML